MTLKSPHDLLILELKDLDSTERQIAKAVPKLSKVIGSDRLGVMLEERREAGIQIVEAITDALEQLDASKTPHRNAVIQALLAEVDQRAQQVADAALLDAAVAASFEKIQQHCLASWRSAAALARAVQQPKLVVALERACERGSRHAQSLNELAESAISVAMPEAPAGKERDPPGERPKHRTSG